MRPRHLVLRGLGYYWRTNVAVIAGVATAVAVLAGALLVGESVRASLRDLVLQRLGATDQAVVSAGFFRERLADDLRAHRQFSGAFQDVTPVVVAPGFVTDQESGRRAGQVRVYGVDERFWRFHGVTGMSGPADRDAFVSPALARDIGAAADRAILVRVQRPSDIPLESLHGRKEDVGRTMRLTVRVVVPAASLGEFSLEPQQGEVRAVFVPLSRLQKEIEVGPRVNMLLVRRAQPPRLALRASASLAGDEGGADLPSEVVTLQQMVRTSATLEDLGITFRASDDEQTLIVGSTAGLLLDEQARALAGFLTANGIRGRPVFTYLANTFRVRTREIPYSLVTALDLAELGPPNQPPPKATAVRRSAAKAEGGPHTEPGPPNAQAPPIVLNEWAARELQASVGDPLTMEYYQWVESGQLVTRTTEFRVASVVPVHAGSRDLVPEFPGISDSPSLEDWDPPFPVDLRRIRPVDEEYWDSYRTTPKAFIPLETGQTLWGSRYGSVTSIRVAFPDRASLEQARQQLVPRAIQAMDPLAMGLAVRDVRLESLAASRGATDFGQYFVYFSFFLVVSALLLASLFFKLGIEQRAREVGLLRAVGFDARAVRRLFVGEGLVLALAGSALGVVGAVAYAWLIMTALGTWWVGAVGTTTLTLHVSASSLVAGAAGGVVAAVVCIWWTLRGLRRISERSLLAGNVSLDDEVRLKPDTTYGGVRLRRPGARYLFTAGALAVGGMALVGGAWSGTVEGTGAFFGAGAALLGASLCLFAGVLRLPARRPLMGHGWWPVSRLGLRSATSRPGRSVLSAAVIASATFMLISVDGFRRDEVAATENQKSGIGGYQVLVETELPIVQEANYTGRRALNLENLGPMKIEPFRLLPGDDASCLNLYEPKNPRILAPRDEFLRAGRFDFQSSLAASDGERANPWLLLLRAESDGAVPVIADANSLTYVLHRALGQDIVITRGGRPVRLRLVAALRDSIFQGELLMSRANFLTLFPDQEGSQVFLVDTPPDRAAAVAEGLEDALSEYGADAMLTTERLAAFHRVENTYLSTFQTLGGLGLLLGTVGLATVLLRNALERRRELALLGAVGYRRPHFGLMVLAENVVLLAVGLLAGAASASLAIAPAIAERGGRFPLTASGVLLLVSVFVSGLLSSAIATRAVTRAPLLASLRSE